MLKEDYYNHFGFETLEKAIDSIQLGNIDNNGNTLIHALAAYGTETELKLLFKKLSCIILSELYGDTVAIVDNFVEIPLEANIVFVVGGHYKNAMISRPLNLYPFNNEPVILENVNINSDYVHFNGITIPLNIDTNYHYFKHDLTSKYFTNEGTLLQKLQNYANVCNQEKYSPVFLAIKHYQLDNLKYLIDQGFVDVNQRGISDYTPLHYVCGLDDKLAIQHAPIQTKDLMLQYLLNKKAKMCQSAGLYGLHPIHVAVLANNLSLVKILLDHGASLLEKTYENNTVLHLACMNGSLDTINYCLGKSLFVGLLNSKKQTALHLAIKEQPLSVIKILISRGYDVNQVDDDGNTAFHYALIYHRFDFIDFFLTLAVPNILNKKKESVMTLAAHYVDATPYNHYFNVMVQFAKYKYVDNRVDNTHKSALDYMKERTNSNLVKSLYINVVKQFVNLPLMEQFPELVENIIRTASDQGTWFRNHTDYYLGHKDLGSFLSNHKEDKLLKDLAGNLSLADYYKLVNEIIDVSHMPDESLYDGALKTEWQYRYIFLPFINSHNDDDNLKFITDETIFWFDASGKSLLYYAILDHQDHCVKKILSLFAKNHLTRFYIDSLGISALYCAMSAVNLNNDGTLDSETRNIAKACLQGDLNMSIGYDSSMKMALRLNDADLVKMLIETGFDVHHADGHGRTLYDYALLFNNLNPAIIKLLNEIK